MPRFGPISRRDLIRHLRQLGYDGPYAGGRHSYMHRGTEKLRIPNPHQGDIDRSLLGLILREADIDRDEWDALK